MNFSVISKQDSIEKYKKATNKNFAIRLIADLTASNKEEVAEFLGLKLIDKYPWVLEE